MAAASAGGSAPRARFRRATIMAMLRLRMSRPPPSSAALCIALASALAAAAPRSALAGPEEEAVRHVKAAQTASDAGNHRKAVNEYEAGYKAVPNPNLLIAMALEWRSLGDNRQAV